MATQTCADRWVKYSRLSDPPSYLAPDENLEVSFLSWIEDSPEILVVSYLHHGVMYVPLSTAESAH